MLNHNNNPHRWIEPSEFISEIAAQCSESWRESSAKDFLWLNILRSDLTENLEQRTETVDGAVEIRGLYADLFAEIQFNAVFVYGRCVVVSWYVYVVNGENQYGAAVLPDHRYHLKTFVISKLVAQLIDLAIAE
jgi:hypothetical protein